MNDGLVAVSVVFEFLAVALFAGIVPSADPIAGLFAFMFGGMFLLAGMVPDV